MKNKIKILLIYIFLVHSSTFSITLMQGVLNQEVDIVRLYIEAQYSKIINLLENKTQTTFTASDYYYLGMSYSQLRKLNKALDALHSAVALDSVNDGYRLSYGRLLNQYGKTNEAVNNYNVIINHDSLNSFALHELGLIYINRKEYQQAKKIFSKLCEQNKEDFLSAYYLALTKVETAETESDSLDASLSISNATRLNIEYTPSFELAGAYCLANNNYMPAFAHYSRLTVLNPTKAEYFYRAGFCLEKTKNYDGAIGLFNKAIGRDSTVANYYSHLGYAYFMAGEYDSSLVAYRSAALLDFENPASYMNLGLVYEKMDSIVQAKFMFEKALEVYPYERIIHATEKLILLNYRLKNYEQTTLLCEQVMVLSPNNVPALFYLACTFDAEGKTNKALEYYKKASVELVKDDLYKKELEYVNTQIQLVTQNIKERKFWEGKINE